MNIPENLLCTPTHEYIRQDGDYYYVGITDEFLKNLGGDIVYIELPDVGDVFIKKEVFATIESDSVAIEVLMPLMAEIVEINPAFDDGYDAINNEPLSDGWIMKVKSYNIETDMFDFYEYNDYKSDYGTKE
ncbi:MAG: glycine cleavage system protein H [Candidatus Gastranaerophilaceae bacterium]